MKANRWLATPVAAILALGMGSQWGGPATVLRIAVIGAGLTVIAATTSTLEGWARAFAVSAVVIVAAGAMVVLALPTFTRHLKSPTAAHREAAGKRAPATATRHSPHTSSPTAPSRSNLNASSQSRPAAASTSSVTPGQDRRPRVELPGAQLPGSDLRGLALAGSDLAGADLAGADLAGMDLTEADLSGADLSGACLRNARLDQADLSGADMSGADVTGARLPASLALAGQGVRARGQPPARSCR